MYRVIARAQLRDGMDPAGVETIKQSASLRTGPIQRLISSGEIMTVGCFKWKSSLFLYCECIRNRLDPDWLLPELAPYLEEWPGQDEPRKWVPMIDVFHFNEPASAVHWLRKEHVERRVGRVAHLKPEMAASYIYYHYQLQEERAFHGPKYEIIAMHENLLFGYQEFPAIVEPPVVPGKLETKGTPENWSDSRMDLHFQPWEDGHLFFKPIDTLFAYYCEDLLENR